MTGVHKILEKGNMTVFQMALSGRAAQRLRESTKRHAFTIYGFVMQVRAGKIDVPDDALIIVDEASMLDLPTIYRLLDCMPPGARLLLVGDPYQLPPIGFGLVFDVLVDSENVPTVELKAVHRQSEASGIPAVATAIRNQKLPELLEYDSGLRHGVSFIDCDISDIPLTCWDTFTDFTDSGIDPYSVRALSPLKKRESGVECLNEVFQGRFKPGREMYGDIRFSYAIGDPILHLENDYQEDLYNGSLGVIEQVVERGEGNVVRVKWDDGKMRDLQEADIYKVSLSYGMTIHKAQGSQFSRVIIPVVRSRLLDNSMVYTALTRGVDQVIFIGDRNAFNDAVQNPPRSKTRDVGFSLSTGIQRVKMAPSF
jgi:exodeoxyribonuclease V alpha subunit